MAEISISRAVGATPAKNLPTDVQNIQSLLKNVNPPLSRTVIPTGKIDKGTLDAILEYQSRFMKKPDGRIDPNGPTLMRLNWDPTVDKDFATAVKWLDVVNRRLVTTGDADMKLKVKNVFHIEFDNSAHAKRLQILCNNYRKLQQGLKGYIPREYHPGNSLFQAWVNLKDPKGTMHFPRNHFNADENTRVGTVIHEQSHAVLKISHSGMKGAGQINFGQNPDDDNGFTYNEAIANAYCYGWLAVALQPTYKPVVFGEVITASPGK